MNLVMQEFGEPVDSRLRRRISTQGRYGVRTTGTGDVNDCDGLRFRGVAK